MVNHPNRARIAPVLNKAEINLVFEWFHATKDAAGPLYLSAKDYALINRLAPYVGRKPEKES